MRNIYLISVLIFLLFQLVLQSSFALADSSNKITRISVGIDEWPPYHSKNLKHYGFCTQIIIEAFEAVGIETEIEFIPWVRALNYSSEGGELDATIWGGYTDWIETHYASDPVCRGDYVLFIRKGLVVDFNKPDTLQGLTMGNLIGEGIPDQLQEVVKDRLLEVESTATVKSMFQMLGSNRIDMVAINRDAGLTAMGRFLSKKQREQISIHPDRFRVSFYRLVVSRKNKEKSLKILEKFNTGLDILNAEGRMNEIIEAGRRDASEQ